MTDRDSPDPKPARTAHEKLHDAEDDECPCSQCQDGRDEAAWDRQQERMLDYTPPRRFTMADKDDPDGYRP